MTDQPGPALTVRENRFPNSPLGVTLCAMSYRVGLAVVATFPSKADAEIAKGVLAAAGVDCLIRSDNAGDMYPSLAAAELLVRAEDAAKAKIALAQAVQASQ